MARQISRGELEHALRTLGATAPDKAVRGADVLAELARMKCVKSLAPAVIGFVPEFRREFYDAKAKRWAIGAGRPKSAPGIKEASEADPAHAERGRNYASGTEFTWGTVADAFQDYRAAYGDAAAKEWLFAALCEITSF